MPGKRVSLSPRQIWAESERRGGDHQRTQTQGSYSKKVNFKCLANPKILMSTEDSTRQVNAIPPNT